GSECGVRAELGALLVRSKAILRGQDVGPVATELPDAVRRRGEWVSLFARRALVSAATEGRRLRRNGIDRAVAQLDSADSAVGSETGSSRWLQPQRLGPDVA